MIQNGLTVETVATTSASMSSGGASLFDQNQQANAIAFNNMRQSFDVISVGPKPPGNGAFELWVGETSVQPMPVTYELESLDVLLAKHLKSGTHEKV